MLIRFTAHAVSILDLDDLNTFLIVLAYQANEPTYTLEFQKALEVDENDPDSDTYCLVVNGGATHYGGVSSCHLSDGLLTLRFDQHAAKALCTPGFEISLGQAELPKLREGLQRLFSRDRFAPTELVLA